MNITCLGISHKTADVALRERIAMNDDAVRAAIADAKAHWSSAECVIVSTCNRTELYLAAPREQRPDAAAVLDWLAARAGIDAAALAEATVHLENDRAIDHLMRVAAGLDSMVIGEDQILSQVKTAYDTAVDAGGVGRVMHHLMQTAIAAGKRVRTETDVGAGRTSVASVAVEFAQNLFAGFSDKTVLTLGAGKMVELTLRHFAALSPQRTLVCNRTAEKAADLANRFDATAVPFETLADHLVEADVVISSTGAADPIVTAAAYKTVLKKRRFRPAFLIDIAVPRDIEPAVGDLANVYLYNLDDLQQAIAEQMAMRNGQVSACEAIIAGASAEAHRAIQTHDVADIIRELRQQLQTIGEAETQRTLNKLSEKVPETVERERIEKAIAEHTHRLVNKILHRPLNTLSKGEATDATRHAAALRKLFELDETESETTDEHG